MAGDWKQRKVVIVGAGAVGSTFAYALAQSGQADGIVLIDKNRDFAEGQVMDLLHGKPYFPSVDIRLGDASDYADAAVIVMTAGAKQAPGESRLDLLQRNVAIVEGVVDEITASGSGAVLLMVSNPVDILTRVAQKRSGWRRGRVIGSGTVLDSARLRYTIARHCGVDVHNVHAYILGEHGDTEFAAWSMTHIGGVSIEYYCSLCGMCGNPSEHQAQMEETVRQSAYHIIDYKGATWFAVGLALVRIVDAVLRNRNSVLTVSVCLAGEYGIDDVALSVPCIVAAAGVERIVSGQLSRHEEKALSHCAATLGKSISELEKQGGGWSE
ncbi:MAG: L-lactate dehydrogenase [Desulfobacterales bacterium]|nr:L-lactate dehydrogenase [Desulfobacterales bacterium]MBS3756656.1 L-lactate dehydrogenase [Desulfobacterales bacterium]